MILTKLLLKNPECTLECGFCASQVAQVFQHSPGC
jgi:hypothetical protein